MIMIVSVHRITLLETSMHVEINTRLFNNWAPYSCVKAAKRILSLIQSVSTALGLQ